MYSETNDLAFDLMNVVINHLYDNGEKKAAKLIERKRDIDAMTTYSEQLRRKVERKLAYDDVDRRYKTLIDRGSRPKDIMNLISLIGQAPMLNRIYYIFVTNAQTLKKIETTKELYDRVAFSYLHNFEGWREENTFTIESIGEIRSSFASLERSIRFIKDDNPHIFNHNVVRESKVKQALARESYGNNQVL